MNDFITFCLRAQQLLYFVPTPNKKLYTRKKYCY